MQPVDREQQHVLDRLRLGFCVPRGRVILSGRGRYGYADRGSAQRQGDARPPRQTSSHGKVTPTRGRPLLYAEPGGADVAME